MNVVIFQELTTDQALAEVEAESLKYDGLYVEMDDPEQRKYVKQKASVINDMLKALDRARIDKAKKYKAEVEKEAESIRLRLEDANKPFTLLIDEYNAERAKVLAKEKADREAIDAKAEIERDHEFALLMDMQWENEKEARATAKADYEADIAENARLQLLEQLRLRQQQEDEQRQRDEAVEAAKKKAAADNIENQREKNRLAMNCFIAGGIPDEYAKLAVELIAKSKVLNVQINY